MFSCAVVSGSWAPRGCDPPRLLCPWASPGEDAAVVCPGRSGGEESACNAGDPGSIPGSGRSPGEGRGSPLQCSRLESPTDRGAWRAAVYRSQRVGHDRAADTLTSASPVSEQTGGALRAVTPHSQLMGGSPLVLCPAARPLPGVCGCAPRPQAWHWLPLPSQG